MRLISRNDLVITPITSAEYFAKFGVTFKEALRSGDGPVPYKSLKKFLKEIIPFLNPDEIVTMIRVQSNKSYKDAILIRAVEHGKLSVSEAGKEFGRKIKLQLSTK